MFERPLSEPEAWAIVGISVATLVALIWTFGRKKSQTWEDAHMDDIIARADGADQRAAEALIAINRE
jgi:hypothetical protein